MGLVLVGLFVYAALAAPLISPYDPTVGHITDRFLPPSLSHLLGTDLQGRDLFSRIVWGARSSLFVACVSVTVGAAIGLVYGLVSGYIGGSVDGAMMRVVDVMLSIPGLLLTLAIVVWLGPGLGTIALAIAIANVPIFARLARGSVLGLLGAEFVTAARAIGVSEIGMLRRHILPNSLTPLLVTATLAMGTAIVEAAGLGFLGFGPQDPATPEWGSMLTDTFRYLAVGAGFTALFPGVAIVLTVIGLNLLGDSFRESLDPRARR